MSRSDLSIQVFDQLVALAGNVQIVESVIEHLTWMLGRAPTTTEMVDEILKRRDRVERRRQPSRSELEGRA